MTTNPSPRRDVPKKVEIVEIDVTTKLAYERTRVAYDRTAMSWIRTAISLITFGFTLYKFFQFERDQFPEIRYHKLGPREFALMMVATGLLSLLLGSIEHRRNMRALRAQYSEIPWSATGVLTVLMSALGGLAFIAMLLRQ